MGTISDIEAFCRRNDMPWTGRTGERLFEYVDLLERFSSSMNLIGPMKRAEIVDTLLIDSLCAAAVAPPSGRLLDVGSGAGLPGIPLKLCYRDLSVTLIEPREKRSTFLKIAVRRLELKDVDVVRSVVEDLEPTPHDYVISKAFRQPGDWLMTARPWTARGGKIVCMHAAEDTEELEAVAPSQGLRRLAHVPDVSELGAPDRLSHRSISVYITTG